MCLLLECAPAVLVGVLGAMVQLYPPYDDYQKKTSREIPVVVLEPR